MTKGIYIQVPFCGAKCTYCNFATGIFPSAMYAPYVDAVCREMEMRGRKFQATRDCPSKTEEKQKQVPRDTAREARIARDDLKLEGERGDWRGAEEKRIPGKPGPLREERAVRFAQNDKDLNAKSGRTVDTVYVGGGTPSLLETRDVARMMDAVRANFDCAFREVTLEADPETITREKAEAWLAAGFNRVSMGAQSFADAELKATGRRHRRADIYAAIEALRGAGCANVSLDLIAGLPFQTAESWKRSLDELIAIAPEHVSIYLLETDEGSRLGREVIGGGARYSAKEIPTDDAMAEFYEQACGRLAAAGYEHYEISNWAKREAGRDLRSQHNLKYWRREAYLGLGAGAHSFDGQERWSNVEEPRAYVEAIQRGAMAEAQRETVDAKQALDEELFLGLRQLAGMDYGRVERDYGVSLRAKMEELAGRGLLELDGEWARIAPERLTVSNEVFVELMR